MLFLKVTGIENARCKNDPLLVVVGFVLSVAVLVVALCVVMIVLAGCMVVVLIVVLCSAPTLAAGGRAVAGVRVVVAFFCISAIRAA